MSFMTDPLNQEGEEEQNGQNREYDYLLLTDYGTELLLLLLVVLVHID